MSGNLLWCDLETTGLRPGQDVILEVGLAITSPDLKVLWEACYVIRHEESMLAKLDDYVLKMHAENSLLEECLGTKTPSGDGYATVHEIAALGLEAMRTFGCIDCEYEGGRYRTPLAGSTPSFDRGFLRAELPALESQLSHRHIDVSTITELCKRWYADRVTETLSIHRAAPDIARSISQLNRLRGRYFAPYNRAPSPVTP